MVSSELQRLPESPLTGTPGTTDSVQSHTNPLINDVLAPLANSALVEPYNAAATAVNFVSSHLSGGHKLLPEASKFTVEAAKPYSVDWALQTMSSGVGAVVPYTIAGKAMGSVFRGAGAVTGTEALAGVLQSERAAYIAGAFAYDGLRTPQQGESRLGNALGGAAGFYVFGLGNDRLRSVENPWLKTGGRLAVGAAGGTASLFTANLWTNHDLPSWADISQSALGGAMLNSVLPPAQDYATRKFTELQANTRFGAPLDRYLAYTDAGRAIPRSETLNNLIEANPWARVQSGTDYADFATKGSRLQLPTGRESDAGLLARQLGHLTDARSGAYESDYQQAAAQLKSGDTEAAWQSFRQARTAQETSAHHDEIMVNHELHGTNVLPPENLQQEIGAWAAPGGVSYEGRWRQEFSQFMESGGTWRPGSRITGDTTFDPNPKAERPAPQSEEEAKAAEEEKIGTQLIADLYKAGYTGLFAGGAVRDAQLGKVAHDFDIATTATPDQIEQWAKTKGYKVIEVGRQFGIVNLIAQGHEFQIATTRYDGSYSDGRRPDSVTYVPSYYEDAARRDLTINAMLHDPTTNTTYDFFNGKQDIANRLIRTVGDPNQRFAEDKLRMMRVARFASTLGFNVDPETYDAIAAHSSEIGSVSGERIRDEFSKMLSGSDPTTGLRIMKGTGLMGQVLPEVDALDGPKSEQDPTWHPEGNVWEHTLMVLDNIKPGSFERMMGTLLHDIGKPATQQVWPNGGISNHGHAEVGAEMVGPIADRLRLSRAQRDAITQMVADHMKMHTVQEWRPSRLHALFSNPYFEDKVALQHADALATGGIGEDGSHREWIYQRKTEFENMPAKPIIGGDILRAHGLKPGPRIGEIIKAAHDAQLQGQFTDQQGGLAWLQQNIQEFRPSQQ